MAKVYWNWNPIKYIDILLQLQVSKAGKKSVPVFIFFYKGVAVRFSLMGPPLSKSKFPR